MSPRPFRCPQGCFGVPRGVLVALLGLLVAQSPLRVSFGGLSGDLGGPGDPLKVLVAPGDFWWPQGVGFGGPKEVFGAFLGLLGPFWWFWAPVGIFLGPFGGPFGYFWGPFDVFGALLGFLVSPEGFWGPFGLFAIPRWFGGPF